MIPIVTGVKMRHTSSLAVLCTLYIVYIQKLRKCAIVALAYDIGVEIGANSLIQENPCTRRNVDLRPYCQSKCRPFRHSRRRGIQNRRISWMGRGRDNARAPPELSDFMLECPHSAHWFR